MLCQIILGAENFFGQPGKTVCFDSPNWDSRCRFVGWYWRIFHWGDTCRSQRVGQPASYLHVYVVISDCMHDWLFVDHSIILVDLSAKRSSSSGSVSHSFIHRSSTERQGCCLRWSSHTFCSQESRKTQFLYMYMYIALWSSLAWHSITWLHVWPMHSIAKSNLGPPVLASSVLTTEHPTTTQTSFIQSCLFAMFILFFCGLKIGSPMMGKAVHILLTVMNQWLYLWIQLPSLKLKMAALCGPEGELSHSDPSTHHQLVKNELDQIHQQVCFTFVCVCTMYMYTYTNIHSVIDVHAHVCVS